MSKHTPGPWEAKRLGNVAGDTLYQVHVFIEPSIAGLWSPVGNETAEANARLIAAAPDLLAALKSFPGFLADTPAGDAWIEMARRAMDKVEKNG